MPWNFAMSKKFTNSWSMIVILNTAAEHLKIVGKVTCFVV